jgi:quercetin dioxygenase-like cupin family protein
MVLKSHYRLRRENAMTTSTAVPIIRANAEGERRWWSGGGMHTWKATIEETGGAFMMFEDVMGAGKATPLHRHPGVDEMLYVLEGEIMVNIDGQTQRVGAGGTVVAPRGVAHAFCVTSETARMLCFQTPGDPAAAAFFKNASDPAGDGVDTADGSGPVDFGRVQESAKASGATEILGPPPFETP